MADDHEENRGFTIADKRRFAFEATAAGCDERPAEEREADRSAAGKQAGVATDAKGREEERRDTQRRACGQSDGSAQEKSEPTAEITMATFIMSMSTQVLMLMGEIENPATGQTERDIKAAKQVIDILGMLRAKTEGNLDDNERDLFEHVLYDLRMRYVEIMKGVTRP